jgi:8-oxo-dGTP pyrophosphatase MutT (NUDIX family)
MFAFDQPRARGYELRPETGALEADQGLIANLSAKQAFADKACPVVFRDSSMRQILAFEDPESNLQLVKGGIEAGEDARSAALRELEEESGIVNVSIARDLGTWNSGHGGHVWSLQLCTYLPNLPDSWVHRCQDDGGQDLRFFWHDMHQEPGGRWAPHFRRALATIRERTRPLRWRG